jgi:hypothetical protein
MQGTSSDQENTMHGEEDTLWLEEYHHAWDTLWSGEFDACDTLWLK